MTVSTGTSCPPSCGAAITSEPSGLSPRVTATDVLVAQADDDYRSAVRTMDQSNLRHLPIVSGGRLLSMLSIRDLLRVDLEDKGQEIRALHEYLYQVPPGGAG